MYGRKLFVSCVLISCARYSNAVEFNSEFLNIDKSDDISLGQFAHAQYTVPGRYLLDITVNQRYFGSRSIEFKAGDKPDESYACLPADLVATFGLKPALLENLPRLADGQCVDLRGIENASIKYMKNLGRLSISLPQATFEYAQGEGVEHVGVQIILTDRQLRTN